MKANELRERYVNYYTERGHKMAAAASLVPENDTSVLYTSAGMQPLIPYLLGEEHPQGKRLVNVQRCVRTGDIEEVGDDNHLTLFEMLGNWSLGDYFKKEAIEMSYTFLTEELGISQNNIAVTVYKGSETVEADQEAAQTWMNLGISPSHIYYYGEQENWWGPAGETGPCGPDSEMFYIHDRPDCSPDCGPACGCGKYVEIGNNVFMTYYKEKDGSLRELKQKNIDVGLGFERLLVLVNGLTNVYETDLFLPMIEELERVTGVPYDTTTMKHYRVIVEHLRASVFILADPRKIVPSNSEQGYILRRLIRRAIRNQRQYEMSKSPKSHISPKSPLSDLANVVIQVYKEGYPHLLEQKERIKTELEQEYTKFAKTLNGGLKMAERMLIRLEGEAVLSGRDAFKLYETYGFPLELTKELAKEQGKDVDISEFRECYRVHQEKSRAGSAHKFKGKSY